MNETTVKPSRTVATIHRAVEGRRSAKTARLGTWWIERDARGCNACVCVKCPVCERAFCVWYQGQGNLIHPDGTVTPAVACPGSREFVNGASIIKPCGWRQMVRFDDWKPTTVVLDPRSVEYREGR